MKKKTLLTSLLTIAMCLALIAGSTYALFTSEDEINIAVTSGKVEVIATINNNSIATTSLGVAQTPGEFANGGSAELEGDTLTLAKLTPGDSVSFTITVENKSTVAMKYRFVWSVEGELAQYLTATVDEVALVSNATPFTAWTGENTKTLTVVVTLPSTVGNEARDLDADISFKVEAIQGNADVDAIVSSEEDLRKALAEDAENILITDDIVLSAGFNVESDANINGNGYTITRTPSVATFAANESTVYDGTVFNVAAGATLTLENITVDGGAVWTGEINEVLQRGTVNSGVTASGALVVTEANATIILGEGAILQNNCGANAVNLGTRTGGKLIVNGGEIINNYSAAGAIWGGGEITINSGKVNGNHGGIGGAIRVVTNIGTVLTMNGGEMNHNYSDGNGGAIWAGSSRSNNVYVLNGGEMAYNYSATTGGAIYAGYYETVKIGGTFKMHDNNCAADLGAEIRFHDHASFVMTGGEISSNEENALFLNNNSTSITGGKITGNFGYSGGLGLTVGKAEIDGVIAYNLGTNHNTAYLAAEFNGFKFTVNEGAANFAQFNFKPAEGYTYTEGDEDKLVCLNEGYETYWDATTGTFRLQAAN